MKASIINTLNLDVLNNIVEYVVDEINSGSARSLEDSISNNMDSVLIYDDDIWDLMKEYQRPSEANFDEAWQLAWEDIYSAIEIEEDEDEEEDDEEDE